MAWGRSMSWATLLKNVKPVEAEALKAPPQQVVYAVDTSANSAVNNLENPTHATAAVNLPSFTKGLLILDANAIIKGMDNLISTADALVTTPQVIAEIKDKDSRDLLKRLPYPVTVLDPTPEAVAAVIACAEKTGDFGAMSRTDIRLCALAMDCCRVGGFLLPPIEPQPPLVNPGLDGVEIEMAEQSDDEEGEGEDFSDEDEGPEGEGIEGESESVLPGWGGGNASTKSLAKDDDDGEGEWITPENIAAVKNGGRGNGEQFNGGMACVTSDYAMQNTMMHLGVPIICTSGLRITELRLWLLRCISCYALVMDTTRQFCPDCGAGDTLFRVSYMVNEAGEKKLFINFKRKISKRGTIYNLPKPRGGKRGTNRNLVLREDQLAHVIRGTSSSSVKHSQVMRSNDDDDALAAFGEVQQHKKRNIGDPRMFSSYHKYNVNEKKKARAAHRK